jgi:hypothetical protein
VQGGESREVRGTGFFALIGRDSFDFKSDLGQSNFRIIAVKSSFYAIGSIGWKCLSAPEGKNCRAIKVLLYL